MTDYMKEAERLLDEYIRVARLWMAQNTGDAEMAARAALLAHIQRGAVPEGWQLVPINCTPEMRAAWDAAPNSDDDDVDFHCGYRAMLAAAPAPGQFRDAAKMMAAQKPLPSDVAAILADNMHLMYESGAPAPAEVPMPDVFMYGVKEPDGGAWMQEVCVSTLKGDVDELVDDLNEGRDDEDTRYTSVSLVTTEDAKRYGAACRAAGEAAGYARGLKEASDRIRRGREILDAALRGEVKP